MPESLLPTRRSALLLTLGLAAETAFAAEFWDQKQPADWTPDEVERLLSKSPWTKEASIVNTARIGPLGSPLPDVIDIDPAQIASAGPVGPNGERPIPEAPGKFKARVRWESALPVRQALKRKTTAAFAENYVINVVGDIPNVLPSDDDSSEQRQVKLDILKERTRLERRNDPIDLVRVELAPASPLSRAGTLFYFSRDLPLTLEDKQVTFVTKLGPLEIKCKFTLKEMLYRGHLEL